MENLEIGDPKFIAFNREAELAKRLMCSGLSALRKATPRQPGIYYDAFFGISIGVERIAKLAWLIDECIETNGAFPTDKDLRKACHNINKLVAKARLIRSKRNPSPFVANHSAHWKLPSDPATDHVIRFLSDFAERSRFFNLKFIIGESNGMSDPIKSWHNTVGAAVLGMPEVKAKKGRWQAQAEMAARAYSPAVVFVTAADGTPLTNVAELSYSEQEAAEINKQAQWKTLAIIRFLSLLILDLADTAHAAGHNFIPVMSEHFGFFCGDNAIIRRYKVWPPR